MSNEQLGWMSTGSCGEKCFRAITEEECGFLKFDNLKALRDEFAKAALIGVSSRSDYLMFPNEGDNLNDRHIAEVVFRIADAMMEQRDKS